MLIFIPCAWAVHFTPMSDMVKFISAFAAIIPLSKLLDYGGEQLALYCGKDLGDLVVVTLNNAVEAALALFLLSKCKLRLLQSAIVGVVLLRLLLIPGTSFIAGGARVAAQELHPHVTQLNHSLLTTGVLTLLLPASFFAGLDRGMSAEERASVEGDGAVNDTTRDQILKISRGLAFILLSVYICSRFFLHAPPGEEDSLHKHKDAPAELKEKVEQMVNEEPELNPWACTILLIVAVSLMAFTAECLVDSIRPVRDILGIQEEWFGLILLPLVSFSADGILATIYFIRYMLRHYLGTPIKPGTLAEARAIDVSIQFTIFWMPLLVLIGWFLQKPISLLFDVFEVAVLLGACFLLNYVTADSKTNWAEGAMMVAFYIMIALAAWFYPGQKEIHIMMSCTSVQQSVFAHEGHANDGDPSLVQVTDHTKDVPDAVIEDPSKLIETLQTLIELYGIIKSDNEFTTK